MSSPKRDPQSSDAQPLSRRASTPHLRRILTEFYRTAVDDYRRAGYPFGTNIEGLLIWFEHGQQTRAN